MKLIFYPFYRYIFIFLIFWFILLKTEWVHNEKNIIKISILSVCVICVTDSIIHVLKVESGIKTENELSLNISIDKKKQHDEEAIVSIVDEIIDSQEEETN